MSGFKLRHLSASMLLACPYLAVADTAPHQLDKVEVTGVRKKLDAARNALAPEIGASTYRFDKQDIANLPL